MFISTKGGKNPTPIMSDWVGVDGAASSDGSDHVLGYFKGLGFGAVIFTNDHTSGPTKTYLQKTMMHELGHLLGVGRADDSDQYVVFPDEIYSGRIVPNDVTSSDPTIEYIRLRGNLEREWSVMSGGWNNPINKQPMDGVYVPYSIEELSTINFENIDTLNG